MKKQLMIALLSIAPALGVVAQDKLYKDEFPLGDITLLDGPLKHARDLNVQVLLKYDCDRMLAPYRKEAGLQPRKPSYPNWDGLDGHVGGHYLSALAINAATGNEECRKRMEYMISELQLVLDANNQRPEAWCHNYIGGVPNSAKMWTAFSKGDFGSYFGIWAPFYNIHKMYAGLRDAWLYCGNEQAKNLFLKFCDWAVDITRDLNDEQMEKMLGNEHGGMNEVLADAYAITGEQKYLDCARRFSHRMLLVPLENGKDCLDNMHANTQIPKVIGYQRIAELAHDVQYHNASEYFWEIVTRQRSLALGGNSRREHFPTKETCIDYINDIDGPESCNTYNMLKLTEDLNRVKPDGMYGDFYETAMFNHILSTQHPQHGGYVYFTSARPRHYRNYSAPNKAMWCCVGTGMENHGKYGQFVWTHDKGVKAEDDALYVNLFVASELNWKERKMVIRQQTAFPYAETSVVEVAKGKGTFILKVRKPSWCENFTVKGVGFDAASYEENGFVCMKRKWKKGDQVKISMPMHAYIKPMINVPQYVAIMYGPILLGMKTGTEDMRSLIADDSRFGQYAGGKKLALDEAPILLPKHLDDIAKNLKPVPGKPLHFKLATHMENTIDGELQPFFEIHDSRYMMYWLALGENDYKAYMQKLADEEKARQALEARTVDKVNPGEQQPETDHRMETDDSNKGNTEGIFFRDAKDGHYFSYLMQTKGETNLSLQLKFWGQDEWRTSEFDIYVNDKLLCSVNNSHRWRTTQFKTVDYVIPSEFVKGKKEIRVKFVAHKGKQVGQIYGVRLVKH
ncbi:glycoside hydrolase family 127 protein [Segatella copri]|uniref:Glycoside hydrolase family 127 protein n=1 Tax=Segatella copri TaxID=165179 RepID=A0AAW5I8J3_9BACT|nr:beta-L-arabinofuranosidase domain-containing protein [Segatella copri]MCF0068303.1 glycoside hydrolase family 127 protein [Segatella copri]MCP9459272.1 glycoside hydrolase family 127 protein [Segatella copri]MCP9502395.1 glycoside hydrolase family 127 protein [Segatella copri]MCP9505341.1 glycoside hydrolase family 127 protein [Segatella copri]MCP9508393.1 glycoside hydrolase family 127 protein [Segatella copri]